MITIRARVVGENIELIESPLLASKSRNTVQIEFEFDEAWNGFGRTALFWGADDEVYTSHISNGLTTVPHEALADPGKIKFGVYGENGTKRIVTVKVTYKIIEGAYTSVASESIQPSPSLLEQIEASLGVMEDYAAQMTQTAETAVGIAQSAKTTASEALDKATAAENDAAEQSTQVAANKDAIELMSFNILSYINGGYVQNGVGYFTHDNQVVFEMTGIGGGGGGGGSSSGNNAILTMNNISGWVSKSISSYDEECIVSFNWTSEEKSISGEMLPTGNGSLTIRVNGTTQSIQEVAQGDVHIDVIKWLKAGSNIVSLTVTDIDSNNRTINVTVTKVELKLDSDFDPSTKRESAFSFSYTPTGNVQKMVYFYVDNVEIGRVSTSINGRPMSFTIPQQSHGPHTLDVWFTATVNAQEVTSNVLHYEFIAVDPLSDVPIIASDFNRTKATQYETLVIPYSVYLRGHPTDAPVKIRVNDEIVASLTVGREVQKFTYRFDTYGNFVIVISCGEVNKRFELNVSESDIHPEAETDLMSLHLTAVGRSNSEDNPAVWEYGTGSNKIAATFTGFNWRTDGWIADDEGLRCLRIARGSQVVIPCKPFVSDFVSTGKTIEIEFAVRDVMDYNATVASCWQSDRGFVINADNAKMVGRGTVACTYGVERRMRLTFAVQPRSGDINKDYRLMFLYIDGEYQSIKQYGINGSFAQQNPVGITLGSPDCTVDVYSIRIYDRYLDGDAVLMNYIADRQNVTEMVSLYRENDIFDANGNIDPQKLAVAMPALSRMIIGAPALPRDADDSITIEFDFWDTYEGAQRYLQAHGSSLEYQGTSSLNYAVKNFTVTLADGATVNGFLVAGFDIRPGEILVNQFVLKADVASSESANNVLLAKLYNDLSKKLRILTPPQTTNSNVRVGIDGQPSAMFWDYGDGPEFVGKYNFNNGSGTFDTFGYTENDEAWDVRDNESLLSKYRTDVFPTGWQDSEYRSIYPGKVRNPETGKKERWADLTHLRPLQNFIYGTWTENASGTALESPVTYGGVTYSNDTAEYRLARFKALYPTYWDMRNQAFYYVFTLFFLLADSRQKNEHIVWWNAIEKWWDLIWDADTALGTDNLGLLLFEYWMEDDDLDPTRTSEDVQPHIYSGWDNVKWQNFKAVFWDEIVSMYREMRNSGMLDADYLKSMFTNWQVQWPKAMWNRDGIFKYANPNLGFSEADLNRGQGSKRWQRDEFIDWRIPYLDSLFDTNEADKKIEFRPYFNVTEQERAAGAVDIQIEVYKCCYINVKWNDKSSGGTSSATRTRALDTSRSYNVENPYFAANNGVCTIRNAKTIKDVHGMENLYLSVWDSTDAENLQAVRLGSGAQGYSNTVLTTVEVGANRKLRLVDVRNCPSLGITVGAVGQPNLKLSRCPNIEKVYASGTSLKSIELPEGGVLTEIAYPATIENIIIRNHAALDDSHLTVESYSNVRQLWLENMTGIDELEMLKSVPASTAIRITGFYWEAEDAEEIEDIFDLFDAMRGIDINGHGQGEEVATAQVSGIIHTDSLSGEENDIIEQRRVYYPSVTVIADHTTATLTLKNWDGSSTVGTVIFKDGVAQSSIPSVPARTQTAQYSYTAVGWATTQDAQTATSGCTENVLTNRTVYAAYSRTVNQYTITWNPNNGGASTTETYNYGDHPSYKGTMPTKDGQTATGWSPAITNDTIVTGTATYTATYKPVWTATFVLAAADNNGTARTLKTESVIDGNTPTPPSETPTSSRGNDYTFKGWSPAVGAIHANTTYTAVFEEPQVWFDEEIEDDWATIISKIEAGTADYKTGNYKPLNLGAQGIINMQIVAKNVDALASGSGNATYSLIGKELLKDTHRWNPSRATDPNDSSKYQEGTGTIGGWGKGELRSYMKNTIKPLIPETVRNAIKEVTKYSYGYNTSSTSVNNMTSTDDVWIPSYREVFGSYETSGPVYNLAFTNNASRVKKNVSSGSASWWWLRSAYNYYSANFVYTDGSNYNGNVNYTSGGLALGFCL